jgi:hypothetical protein
MKNNVLFFVNIIAQQSFKLSLIILKLHAY